MLEPDCVRYIIQVELPGEKADMSDVEELLANTGVELDPNYGPILINPKLRRYVVRGLASPEARAKAEDIGGVQFFADARQQPMNDPRVPTKKSRK